MIDEEMLSAVVHSDVNLRLIEPHIYSVCEQSGHRNIFDRTTAFYDLVIANRCYNRLIWGYSTGEFAAFCRDRLVSSTQGWVLDIGCGSLVFTAGTYASYTERPVVFSDESLQMLRAARSRLIKLNGCVPDNMVFLHADAQQMPFRSESFQTIIAMNLLHVLKDAASAIHELGALLTEEGTISYTTIVLNKRISDINLKLLGKMGLVVPRSPDQLLSIFDEQGIPVKHYTKGNIMFIYQK
ncbi:class I SAM-dependent methyltransferase [Chloroflexota bacterium]